jgi:DNA-binding response OmpR family regulator
MDHDVLVVDDHPPTVQLVRTALTEHGINVRTAENGAECLIAVDEQRPDAIILDVMMPVMDGFQALRLLQETEGTRDIPVIMLTACSSDRDVVHGWRSGVTCYLTKPFSIEHLVSMVRRVLDTAGLAELEAEEAG